MIFLFDFKFDFVNHKFGLLCWFDLLIDFGNFFVHDYALVYDFIVYLVLIYIYICHLLYCVYIFFF